jgi:tRNA (mo5U34)-methyltransferase
VTEPEELQAQADAFGWYHTIDLGHGVVTKGISVQETSPGVIPDVSGRSVLDVGAWDGKFSFAAEQAGASRVVALDHYAWGVDFVARGAYWAECIANGTLPDQSRDETDFWRPDLPGQRGFNFAKAALDSKVEPVVGDFQKIDLDELGVFDVVLYLGVLYHMKEPLTCLERLRAVTKEVAVIETEAVHIQGFDREVLMQFHAGSDLRVDFGNWYVPTIEALHNLCRAAGFSEVRTVIGPPPPPAGSEHGPSLRQKVGSRVGGLPIPVASAPSLNYRAVVHAFS